MKVIIGDKVYIQEYDMCLFLHILSECPGYIMAEITRQKGGRFFSSKETAFNFVCFEGEGANELKEMDYILDFDEYKEASTRQIRKKINEAVAKLDKLMKDFDKLDWDTKIETSTKTLDEVEKLRHTITSLDYMRQFVQKKISFPLPPRT